MTRRPDALTIDNMPRRPDTLTDLLRTLLAGSVLREVARDTGLDPGSLSRFATGKRSLRLDMADRLVAYYGIRWTLPQAGEKTTRPARRTKAPAIRSGTTPRRPRRGNEGK